MSHSRPPLQVPVKGRAQKRNAAFRLVGNVVVVVHNAVAPTSEEWEQYIATLFKACKLYGNDLSVCRQFVLTDGGGPNSAQRAASLKAAEQMPHSQLMPVAVVSSSTFVRGIVTAFNWFNMNLKAFSPQDVHKAISFLKIDEPTVQAIYEELTLIEHDIGPVETIQIVREARKRRP